MGVRVNLEILLLKNNSRFQAVGLLNTGFEGEKPEVLIPIRFAEKLRLWPKLPENVEVRSFETPGGLTRMYCLEDIAEVSVEGKASIKCSLIISEAEHEVLLNDQAIEGLKIVIEEPGKGLWRFRDETENRQSLSPQYW
jgi:predicted aspartyl protease